MEDYDVLDAVEHDAQLLDALSRYTPTVVLLDYFSPPRQRDIVATLHKVHEMLHVLAFVPQGDLISARRAFAQGVLGLVAKTTPPKEIVRAVSFVAAGQRYLSPEATCMVIDGLDGQDSSAVETADLGRGGMHLSNRDESVLELLRKGLTNSEIASVLGVSARTIKGRVSNLLLRFQVSNRTELVGALGDEESIRMRRGGE